jgi:hypothetical protein
MPLSAHGSVKAHPVAYTPGAQQAHYGRDNEDLARILMQHEAISPVIELVEAFRTSPI